MKLKPLQLCRLCGYFHRRRRLIGFAAALLIALILPGVLRTAAVTVWVLAGVLMLLERFLVNGSRLPVCLRTPRPEDALCETVLVDAALIGRGTRLRAVAQPVDVAPEMSLRLGSGTLLLGAAMVLTAEELSLPERSAIHRAVHRINIVPQRLQSHQMVISRETQSDVTIVTVRDGGRERRYYMGGAEAVSGLCSRIWEGEARAMTEHDRLRILDTARYIGQGNCRVTAYATALADEEPVYLGAAGVGAEVDPRAVQDVTALRERGLTVMLDAGDDPEVDLTSLRALAGLQEHHARADVYLTSGGSSHPTALTIHRDRGESLLDPVVALQEAYRSVETLLRRCALLMLAAMVPGLGGHWAVTLLTGVMLLAGAALFNPSAARPAPGKGTLAVCAAVTVIAWVFLGAIGEMTVGCGVITLLTMLGSLMRLCDVVSLRALRERRYIPLAFAACCMAVIALALILLPGACSLPGVLFSVLLGAANAMVLMRGK